MAKKKAKGGDQEKSELLNVVARFGRVSFGEEMAGISFRVDRDWLDLSEAERLLCGKRLSAKLASGGADAAEQTLLFDDLEYQVNGVFECRRIGCSPTEIGGTLNIMLDEIEDGETFRHLAGRQGRLVVTATAGDD